MLYKDECETQISLYVYFTWEFPSESNENGT